MLGLKGTGKEPDCVTMLGSSGPYSGKGSQRSGTSEICLSTKSKVDNRMGQRMGQVKDSSVKLQSSPNPGKAPQDTTLNWS